MSGLEAFAVAASIIQVAELGTKLSVQLFSFYRQVKSANESIQLLSNEIALVSAILRELGDSLQDEGSSKLCSDEALQTLSRVLNQCRDVLGQIQRVIDSNNQTGQIRRNNNKARIGSDEAVDNIDSAELKEYNILIESMLRKVDLCKSKLEDSRHLRIKNGVLNIHSGEIVRSQLEHGPSIHIDPLLFAEQKTEKSISKRTPAVYSSSATSEEYMLPVDKTCYYGYRGPQISFDSAGDDEMPEFGAEPKPSRFQPRASKRSTHRRSLPPNDETNVEFHFDERSGRLRKRFQGRGGSNKRKQVAYVNADDTVTKKNDEGRDSNNESQEIPPILTASPQESGIFGHRVDDCDDDGDDIHQETFSENFLLPGNLEDLLAKWTTLDGSEILRGKLMAF
ncbi:uncharacterized protein PGRI_012360 [Penicillium griseofulvum]|uniref:Fungal N-terminal domain-containing protein n=1 Tax=Penicillium patulum TaxID=5078 RepID=A0A135LEH6_PENPA|nr:uncharacterized protein PGRI_012360 [Penicillium griseofulvum]KXG47366.1 hypothetical protein PGRI_012360 [Penicillium griseofulvum]